MAGRRFVGTRWVHVDGDDDARGAIYRDASADLPLSRRPKEFLEFTADGTVRRLATGADDRAHEVDRTTWHEDHGEVVFCFDAPDAAGRRDYRVVAEDADCLFVRRK